MNDYELNKACAEHLKWERTADGKGYQVPASFRDSISFNEKVPTVVSVEEMHFHNKMTWATAIVHTLNWEQTTEVFHLLTHPNARAVVESCFRVIGES